MTNLLLILYTSIFFLAVFSVGRLLTEKFKISFNDKFEKTVFSFSTGIIIFSYLFHLLGAVHLLYAKLLLGIYLCFALIETIYIVKNFDDNFTNCKKWFHHLFTKDNSIILFGLLFIIFPLIPYLFLYPSSWDVLAYHLTLPKFYLLQHSLDFVQWFDQTGFPIGIEALYGFGEGLHEPRISNFIHFSFIIFTTSYLLVGTKNLLSKKARIIATFLYLFQPMLYTIVSISAYADYPLAFFTLISVMAYLKFNDKKTKSNFFFLCFILAFLPLIKFSGIIIVLVLLTTLVLAKLQNKLKNINYQDFSIAGFYFLPFIYWITRNAFFTKNPFYPFFNNIFRGIGYQEGMKQLMKDDILKNLFIKDMIVNFVSSVDTVQDYTNLAAILFMLLGLFAMIFFFKSNNKKIMNLSRITLASFLLLMVVVGPITRYVFFVFPLIAILIANLLEPKENYKDKITKFLQIIFYLIVVLFIFIQVDSTFHTRSKLYTNIAKRKWFYFLNSETANAMLYEQDNYRIQLYANTHLTNQDKVLQLLDNRIYYLDVPSAFANTIGGSYFIDKDAVDSHDTYLRIKNDGFTHAIKLDSWGAHPVMRKELFEGFMNNYVSPIATESGVTLYKIK